MDDIKISSNRSFGIVFFVVFFLIALYPFLKGNDLRIWSLLISFGFLILGLINSKLLTPLNKLWFKFGLILGKIPNSLEPKIIHLDTRSELSKYKKLFFNSKTFFISLCFLVSISYMLIGENLVKLWVGDSAPKDDWMYYSS